MDINIINFIDAETKRQDEIWGANRNLTDFEWLAILVEEVGEIAEAILKGLPTQTKIEVIHAAAVAVQWLENLQRLDAEIGEYDEKSSDRT